LVLNHSRARGLFGYRRDALGGLSPGSGIWLRPKKQSALLLSKIRNPCYINRIAGIESARVGQAWREQLEGEKFYLNRP
jgi:hypothetical protein